MAEQQIRPGVASPPADDSTRTAVGRFAIRGSLGAGGMGVVYLAEDTKLRRMVALKRIAPHLKSDEAHRQRFLREAQFASRLSNPHIAGIHDVIEDAGEIYLVMEYVEGETLRERLRSPMAVDEFLPIAAQCAEALIAAHALGILHLDIKPANIMLTPAGGVKILDFGVARHLPRTDATTVDFPSGTLTGTPAYMPPEVLLEKEPDPRSDIFSLGVVFFEMLAGKNPFAANSIIATSQRILDETPPPLRTLNPTVSPQIEGIVAKMLAKRAEQRYSSAAELLADLRLLQTGSAGSLPTLATAGREQRRQAAIALLAVLLLGAGLASIPRVRAQVSRWLRIAQVPQDRELAVLPFEVVGGDPSAQAFGDGLTETLTAKLTQLTASHALQVISASEVRAKGIVTAGQAREEFGVNLALEGNLRRSGDRVRVNYSLVDTRTHRQIDAESITAAAADPFAVQDQVVNGALRMLEVDAGAPERQSIASHGTEVAGAYDFYLQGRGYLQNYDKVENLDSAITVFGRALALDPNYALAYAGLGEARWEKYELGRDIKWVDSARQACERSLGLNAELAAAHVCLGRIESGTGEYETAAKEFEQALAIEPTSDDAYRSLADAYEGMGKPAEAERIYRKAIALRPHYWAGYSWLGAFYYHQARYADAASMFAQVVALVPDSIRGYSNLGTVYYYQGRYADAIELLRHSISIRPTADAESNLGSAYFYLRKYGEAASAYEEAVKLNGNNYMVWWNLGDGYYFWGPEKRAQAEAAYRRTISLAEAAVRVNPRDSYALGVLAYCHAMLGERKPALDNLQQALKLAPGDSEARFKAALVYAQFGDSAEALDWLTKALSAGFSATIVRDTPNFDSLRSNSGFQKLIQAK